MRRNQPSDAPGLRANLARDSAGFGAGPNKRDFSGFGGSRNFKNSQVYRHLHRLPFSAESLELLTNIYIGTIMFNIYTGVRRIFNERLYCNIQFNGANRI